VVRDAEWAADVLLDEVDAALQKQIAGDGYILKAVLEVNWRPVVFVCGNVPEPGTEVAAGCALWSVFQTMGDSRHAALGELGFDVIQGSFEPHQGGLDVADGEQVFHLHRRVKSRLDGVIELAANAGVHALDCGRTFQGGRRPRMDCKWNRYGQRAYCSSRVGA